MLLALQQNLLLGEPPELVTVPDVVGQSQASGIAELEGEGFVVAVATAYSSTVPAGDIISQSPTAGSEATAGSTVTITVSLGERNTDGGVSNRHKRKGHKRRQFVEIDGQRFDVSSQTEATHLLQRARAIAERQSEQRAQVAEKNVARIARRTGRVPQVNVPAPSIKVSADLDVAPLVADIRRLYEKAAELAELRVLMRRQMDEEDEELLLL